MGTAGADDVTVAGTEVEADPAIQPIETAEWVAFAPTGPRYASETEHTWTQVEHLARAGELTSVYLSRGETAVSVQIPAGARPLFCRRARGQSNFMTEEMVVPFREYAVGIGYAVEDRPEVWVWLMFDNSVAVTDNVPEWG